MESRPDLDPFETSTEQRRDAGLTKEDIERLIVDENLGELDRMKMFLAPTAHQLQQSCAVAKLPFTFQEYGLRAYHALVPTITSSLDQFSPQMQVATGEALNKIIQNGTLAKDVVGRLLPTIMNMLSADRTDAVVYAWLEPLCSLVPLLPRKVLTDNLLKLALSKGQPDESSQPKILCARIYGSVAPLLDGKYVEQSFLQRAMALCQDTDLQVRVCMCRQLYPLSKAVGLDTAEKAVLPELCELLKDEEPAVQRASLESLLEMLNMFPPQVKQLKILPVLRLICGDYKSATLISAVPFFGEILFKMGSDVKEEDLQFLVDSFKSFCFHEDEKLRRLCAYNFPAVMKFMGPRKYVWGLQTMYAPLVQDTSPAVRANVAASFHKISKMLGKEKTSLYLKEPLILLLKDTSREVQGSLLPILQHVLGQFSAGNEHQRSATYGAIIPHLLQMEKAISSTYQWRLQLALLNAFPQLPEYVPSDQIYEHFVPVCFRYMSDGALPVRSAATVSLAVFIRHNRRTAQRYELSQRVVKEFANGQSYWSRLVFIEFCESMLKTSSSHMFKENFLESAIVVLQDAVASVRMRACLLIPLLKAAIKLPDDVQALERINFFATQRLNDNDRQVAANARSIADCLKHANIRLPGNEKISQAEFEALDKQKEDEEWNMLSKEEQDEKRKLDEVLSKMKLETYKKTGAGAGGTGIRTPNKVGGGPSVKVKAAAPGILSPTTKHQKPVISASLRPTPLNSSKLDDSEASDVSSLPQGRTQANFKASNFKAAVKRS